MLYTFQSQNTYIGASWNAKRLHRCMNEKSIINIKKST